MMPEVDVRRELEDLGALIAACRERSRTLRQDMLTYHLDMAVHETGHAPPRASDPGVAAVRAPGSASDAFGDGGGPASQAERRRRLVDLRTMVEGCRDRALDLDEGVLSYVLDMALLTIVRTLTVQA